MSFETLDFIADLYNPLLAICALIFGFWFGRYKLNKLKWAITYSIELLIYLTLVYGLGYLDSRFGLWPSLGWDYSTHTAFALAMIWPLWLYQYAKWRWIWPVSFVFYAGLMLYQGYHTLTDILSTSVVISILIGGIQRSLRPQTLYFPQQRFI